MKKLKLEVFSKNDVDKLRVLKEFDRQGLLEYFIADKVIILLYDILLNHEQTLDSAYQLRNSFAKDSIDYNSADYFCQVLESICVFKNYQLSDMTKTKLMEAVCVGLINLEINNGFIFIYTNSIETEQQTLELFKQVVGFDKTLLTQELKFLLLGCFKTHDVMDDADFVISVDQMTYEYLDFILEYSEEGGLCYMDFTLANNCYYLKFNFSAREIEYLLHAGPDDLGDFREFREEQKEFLYQFFTNLKENSNAGNLFVKQQNKLN